jgi:hypothetical protein
MKPTFSISTGSDLQDKCHFLKIVENLLFSYIDQKDIEVKQALFEIKNIVRSIICFSRNIFIFKNVKMSIFFCLSITIT